MFRSVCSAELFKRKVMVPCKPLSIFECEYGKDKWQVPTTSGYKWMNFEDRGNWPDDEWVHAIKFYNANGFDKKRTFDTIKPQLSANFNMSLLEGLDETEDEF
jgi:hypothetical protein